MTMQYLRQLLFVACVCLCVLFSSSHIAYADEYIERFNNEDYVLSYAFGYGSNTAYHFTGKPIANNFTYSNNAKLIDFTSFPVNGQEQINIKRSDMAKIFSKGSHITVSISDVIIQMFDNVNGVYGTTNYNKFTVSGFYIYDISWNATYINCSSGSINTQKIVAEAYDLPFDVYGITICIDYKLNNAFTNFNGYTMANYWGNVLNSSFTKVVSFESSRFSLVEVESTATQGLLDTIINRIITLPNNIANAISGFFDNVVNAVQSLGDTILEGVKSLFLPSEEDITEMKEQWETLLADRFGAIYQAVALVFDYVETFQEREQGTIEFPVVTIPLGETDFEFGGYVVKVVPDGFTIIIDALKLVISISCTVLFVNTLKRKYDKLVEG